ncbi:MAG: TolC family protein [Longimicrobiales bacterium]|nr:TolC family protein [Longimicrobiales bacterium]
MTSNLRPPSPQPRARILLALALLLAPVAVRGQVTIQEPRTISLEEALELFAKNNLELRLARADAAEAAGVARQAGAYPNPTISGSRESLGDDGEDYSESYVNLSQRLEWPAARSARRSAADRAAEAARARLAGDSARLAFEVKEAYTRAARAERAEAVLARVTEVFRTGDRNAAERWDAGDLSLYDRRRIGVELTRYETRLAEAALEAASARRRLALLIDPEGETIEFSPTDVLTELPPAVTAERALETAASRRRELAVAEAEVASAQAAANAARSERIPDLTATLGYKRQSDGFSGAVLGLALPLPLWDRRGGAVEAADARLHEAASRAGLTRRTVENDVRRALEVYRSLARRAERLAGPGTREAEDLLEIAQVAYAEGEMELLDLLDAAEALMDARLAETRLRAELWTSYHDLERAVGGFDAPLNDGVVNR